MGEKGVREVHCPEGDNPSRAPLPRYAQSRLDKRMGPNNGRADVGMNDGAQDASRFLLLPVVIHDDVCMRLRKIRTIRSLLEKPLSADHTST